MSVLFPHFRNLFKLLLSTPMISGALVVLGLSSQLQAQDKAGRFEYEETLKYCIDIHGNPGFNNNNKIGSCTEFKYKEFDWLFKFRLFFHKDLRGSSFMEVQQEGIPLKKKNLEGCKFNGAILRSAHFEKSRLAFVDFRHADLDSAHLNGLTAMNGNYDRANLYGTNFSLSNLDNSTFKQATAMALDMTGVHCQNCDFTQANLSQAKLSNGTFVDASFAQVNFQFTNLQGSKLTGADFSGADLTSAILAGANLKGANVNGALFHHADLRGTDLSEVKMEDAKWRFAKFNKKTVLPFDAKLAVEEYGMVFSEN